MDFNWKDFKDSLINSRLLISEVDYETYENFFSFFNSNRDKLTIEDINFIVYGFDDKTDDFDFVNSFASVIIQYSEILSKTEVIQAFLKLLPNFFPHAPRWCGEILIGWLSRKDSNNILLYELLISREGIKELAIKGLNEAIKYRKGTLEQEGIISITKAAINNIAQSL